MNPHRNILLCGHRSFAARGLIDLLESEGHSVTCFSRGSEARDGNVVTGPVMKIHENPHLSGPFDTVINYILLKDDGIEENNSFVESLLQFCKDSGVKHLIHMSSISVYSGAEKLITEDSLVEPRPERKGSYGSLKVATDHYLTNHLPSGVKLTLVRPGFILGEGLMDPIIGMGFRVGLNRILMIGNGKTVLPITSRDIVNQAMTRIVNTLPEDQSQIFLILDNQSPTRREWLEANKTITGTGTKLVSFPVLLWLMAGVGGEVFAKLIGLKLSPLRIIRNACRGHRFDASESHRRLGMDMRIDWKDSLSKSMPGQQSDFILPYRRIDRTPMHAKHVTFWGFGKVVLQKHLPALKRLGFTGRITAYDPVQTSFDDDNVTMKPIDGASPESTDLMVIVSPGPVHTDAIPVMSRVDGTILVEKPLCYTAEELEEWLEFSRTHSHPVLVCHNYRFKNNIEAMMAHLDRFSPGRLLQVDVLFQSHSIGRDSRSWAKTERTARTLLMDYSIHFLDIACMFNSEWSVGDVGHDLDYMGCTATIQGHLVSPQYNVNFLIRQGYMPRRARLFFTFQNYGVSLGFFPDTFVAHMADDGPAIYRAEKRVSGKAVRRKLLDKAIDYDSDHSHDVAYLAAINKSDELADGMKVEQLAGFYRVICELAQAVYS